MAGSTKKPESQWLPPAIYHQLPTTQYLEDYGFFIDMIDEVVNAVVAIHTTKPRGDVLAYVPANVKILDVYERLERLNLPGLAVIYIDDFTPSEHMEAMVNSPAPHGCRRVVLVSVVTDTSIDVLRIRYVVNTGPVSQQPHQVRMISNEITGAFSVVPGRCHPVYRQRAPPRNQSSDDDDSLGFGVALSTCPCMTRTDPGSNEETAPLSGEGLLVCPIRLRELASLYVSGSIRIVLESPLAQNPTSRRFPRFFSVMDGSPQESEAESPPPAIYHRIPTILEYLEDHPVVIVSAAPGSGKSSVLPRCLAESGHGPVLCAQPRHIAAVVAETKAGKEWRSNIVFTTTRQVLDMFGSPSAPGLAGYGTLVIDEAHDRTQLGTDVLLGMVKAALAAGTMGQCKVVVCTAGGCGPADDTLHDFFDGAPIVSSLRASHPVEVRYSRGPVLDMAAAVVDEVVSIHASRPPGDVLVFLPENADIVDVSARLERLELTGLVIRHIHDNLPLAHVNLMLNSPVPDGWRRVVLATDVAETAVLVRGITYVVDTGLVSEQPLPVRISKETAAARAAIAGFSGPGRCHRLNQKKEYDGLDEHTVPHIRRDGAAVEFALMVKRHAADGMPGFEVFDTALKPAVLKNVFGQLVNGGYLDKLGNLTDKGVREAYDED
uniref:Helicase C-terminal domain-containing protein n=1 Tax=Leersia perrieri TaxID=77586 RepID=A0A0D9VSN4_9ORYZ